MGYCTFFEGIKLGAIKCCWENFGGISIEKRVHGLFGLGNPSWGPLFFFVLVFGSVTKNGQLTFTKNGRLMWFDEWKFAVKMWNCIVGAEFKGI